MEQQQDSIFGLGIDPTTKNNLGETAKWAKLLAICGFIGLGLLILYGFVMSFVMKKFQATSGISSSESDNMDGIVGIVFILYMLVIAVSNFFPLLFTFRFASQMKRALYANDQHLLNESFRNLKITMRYLGILAIIGLALFVFSLFSVLAVSSYSALK